MGMLRSDTSYQGASRAASRGTFGEKKMANLPSSRVEPAPQFSYCAVNYFSPWYIKEGRKEVKRYGVVAVAVWPVERYISK